MTYKRICRWRRLAIAGLAGGMLWQAGGCNLANAGVTQFVQQAAGLLARQGSLLLSDGVFFVLDNALVRLRG